MAIKLSTDRDFIGRATVYEDSNAAGLAVADLTPDTWDSGFKTAGSSLSNGDRTVAFGSGAGSTRATTSKSTGKHYWETTIDGDGGNVQTGICDADDSAPDSWVGASVNTIGYYSDGNVYQNNGSLVGSLTNFAATDVIMFALDLDNGFFYVGVNGTWENSGDPESGATGTGNVASSLSGGWMPSAGPYNSGDSITANFGNAAFSHTVPDGYTPGWGT